MVKPEWGTKRSCPKCGTRFYDLGNNHPVHCINCNAAWEPEPLLKSKQPLPYDAPKKAAVEADKPDADLGDELEGIEDREVNPDEEVDLTTDDDDDIVVSSGDEDES